MAKKIKKIFMGVMCLVIAISMMPVMAQSATTGEIPQVKVKSYSELDKMVEAGQEPYKLQLTEENASVNFTLTKDAYVRVLTVLRKESKGGVAIVSKIKSTNLITDYTKDESLIKTDEEGVYTCNSYAQLTKGTYTITYAESTDYVGYEVEMYLAVLPIDTDFLSMTYVSETEPDINGKIKVTVKLSYVDPIQKLVFSTGYYEASEKVLARSNNNATPDANDMVTFEIYRKREKINVYMVDVCGATHYVTYNLLSKYTADIVGVEDKAWTGQALTQPNMVVKAFGLYPEYNISYVNNINEGTASIVLDGKGEWLGRITTTFQIKNIKVGKVKGLKVTKAKKKSATLKWKKTTNAVKYQVQYSTSKKFKKAKTKTVKKATIKIKKLKNKKKYYFRVRAISSTGYIGKWSSAKKATIKK